MVQRVHGTICTDNGQEVLVGVRECGSSLSHLWMLGLILVKGLFVGHPLVLLLLAGGPQIVDAQPKF